MLQVADVVLRGFRKNAGSGRGRRLGRAVAGLCFVAAVVLWGGAPAAADTPVTHGAAFGEQLSLKLQTLLATVQASSGPLSSVTGDAPPFNQDASALSVSVGLGSFGTVLHTGLLLSHTDSAAAGQVASNATVHDLGLSLVPVVPLLTLHADEVRSSAAIGGTCGSALTATGTTTLINAGAGGTLGLGLHLGASVAPNTVLLNLLGVRVVLNEQIASGDGVTSRALAVNAIHVSVQNSLLGALGRLSGDVVIAHSEARVVCAAPPPPPPPPSGEADLALALTADPHRLLVGDTVTYTVDVGNNGPDPAPGTVLTDVLPAGLSQVAVQTSQGTCSGTSTVVCNLGTLAAGDGAEVVITGVPTAAGDILDTASVASAADDPDPSNNSASVTVRAYSGQQPRADLSLAKRVNADRVSVGAQLTYELDVANAGPDDAPNVVVTDPLPPGLQFLSATASQGDCTGTSTVVCNLGTVAAGSGAVVTLTVETTSTGSLDNSASVSTDAADLDDANDTGTASVTVLPPAIRSRYCNGFSKFFRGPAVRGPFSFSGRPRGGSGFGNSFAGGAGVSWKQHYESQCCSMSGMNPARRPLCLTLRMPYFVEFGVLFAIGKASG
jgi:uncharacterized repeat protein (TIGR01451 family)